MNTPDSENKNKVDSSTFIDSELTFDDFELHPAIEQALGKMGFDHPTPVQAQTYKQAMLGKDIIAMAQTGTGKTAAFGIPLVQMLSGKEKGVAALILAPTRELALQVCREITALGEIRGVKCAAIYGGASFTKQVSEVEQGARIVVGTPGRVLDHIKSRSISFDKTQVLVLDEADEMLSMGFEKEISEIIESLPKNRQNLMFSATIPDDMARLTKRYMGEPTIISVSGDEVGAKEISHYVYLVSGQGRPNDMVKILEEERPDSALIFCNTRDETKLLARHLKNAGYNSDWLNSDLSQHEREVVMRKTRDKEIQFLVATDVAARGIDVSHLSHVINYTFPDSLEIYIHRTGRTGRMGRQGTAISLIAPQNIGNLYYLRLTYKIYPIEKSLGDDKATKQSIEFNRIDSLRKGFSAKPKGEFQSLAKRISQDIHAERIISGLLESYFTGGQTKQQPKEVSKKPEAKKENRQREDRRPQRDDRKPKTDDRRPKPIMAKTPPPQAKPKKAEAPAEQKKPVTQNPPNPKTPAPTAEEATTREIFIDAGRKDGLRISHLMKEIQRVTNLPRAALGKVRMLTRSAFVSVPAEHFTDVLKALGKIELEGNRLKAEPAKQS